MSSKKTVVIVGGGFAGVNTLVELNKKNNGNLNIILISKTDYFYFNIASPRTIVDDTIIPKILLSYDHITKGNNKKFIHGEVIKIGENEIKYLPLSSDVEKKEEILAFDYLVIALGSTYPSIFQSSFNNLNDQSNLLYSTNEKAKSATKILIVGGGPVGIETAGEIATDYPNIKVTLITNSDRLVPYMSNSLSEKCLAVLRQKKVEVIFNDSIELTNVENFKPQKVRTKSGKEIEFDAYFLCFGSKPATQLIKSSFPEWLDNKGFIKVNKNLQVLNKNNIFAIGDCCDTNEPKLAFLAGFHAGVVANNIDLLSKKATKLKEYSPTWPMMMMSIGRDNGAFQFSFFTCTGFLPRKIKSESLLIPKFRDLLGYH